MEPAQHPEYQTYKQHRQKAQRYRQAVTAWKSDRRPLETKEGTPAWTAVKAQALVEELADFFQAYNRVLWQPFPYCRHCLGGCCVVDATDLKAIDYIALALLDEPLPPLPPRLEITDRQCIYLGAQGCRWPTAWRPLKCALFYCLGSGDWQLDSLDERYRLLTEALQQVVATHLPQAARRQEEAGESLLELVADPISFANALAAVLDELFVAAFIDRYLPAGSEAESTPAPASDLVSETLLFITEAAGQLWQSPPPIPAAVDVAAEQLLADLELLEWIVLGRPQQGEKMLAELYGRYALAPAPQNGENPTLYYQMRTHVARWREFVTTTAVSSS